MKKVSLIFSMALLFITALALTSCGSDAGADQQESDQTEAAATDMHDHADHPDHTGEDYNSESAAGAAHGQGAAFTSAYVCPMHCEGSGSSEPGTCPACGMDYVAQADHVGDGHDHN